MIYHHNCVVSIILPTYNREKMLMRCIHSILQQTYEQFEVIVSDDNSTDSTEIIIKTSFKDSRIKYFKNQSRKGLPANRNNAINHAKGDFIFFIEDDMVLDCNCVKFLIESYNLVKSMNVGGITTSLINKNLNKEVRKKTNTFFFFDKSTYDDYPCVIMPSTGIRQFNFKPSFNVFQEVDDMHACSFYPQSIFKKIGGYDDKRYGGNFLFEETDLNSRLKKYGYRLFFEPRAVLYHISTNEGGCRVNRYKYYYWYFKNYCLFVTKNYGAKSIFMIFNFTIAIIQSIEKAILLKFL